MDGSYGPAAQKVEAFVGVLKSAVTVPIKMWDERLTSTMANRILIQGNVRRDKRKEKVDKMAAAILLQSYLDGFEFNHGWTRIKNETQRRRGRNYRITVTIFLPGVFPRSIRLCVFPIRVHPCPSVVNSALWKR